MTEGVTDVALIKDAIEDFAALFATTLPPAEVIEAKVSSTFLDHDEDRSIMVADIAADPSFVGVSFTDVDIKSFDYSDVSNAIAVIDFSMLDGNGIAERVVDFRMHKGDDGVWRLAGNGRAFDIDLDVQMERRTGTQACTTTGIYFWIEDYDDSNNGGDVDHFLIKGPGLPPGGVRYNKPVSGGSWRVANTNSSQWVLGGTGGVNCPDTSAKPELEGIIAAIPDGATYVWTAYSSADNSTKVQLTGGDADGTYRMSIKKRPLTLAETLASTKFPTITSPGKPCGARDI